MNAIDPQPVAKIGRPKGSETRFPGIKSNAPALGVTPEHLRLVLKGVRTSPLLLKRYAALQTRLAENPTLAAKVRTRKPRKSKPQM